jgi:hypothetical protein
VERRGELDNSRIRQEWRGEESWIAVGEDRSGVRRVGQQQES